MARLTTDGVTINGTHYRTIGEVPIYRATRDYTMHLGAEAHAILGNLRWMLETSQSRKQVDERATSLLEAFNWEKTPEGFTYWERVFKETDRGRKLYRQQRREAYHTKKATKEQS